MPRACTLDAAAKDFYRRLGVPEERLFPGPYCVENDRFARRASELGGRCCRERWRIPNDRVVYLFCGKVVDKKHPLELVQAFHEATQRAGNIHLLMVGDGDRRAECEAYAKQHRLPVTFAGFLNQTELPAAYAAADCLVLPSDNGETWGLVVNEAMACGRPAIVSDQVGCSLDLVRPGECGAIFPYGDQQALIRALVEHADVGLLFRQGQRAHTIVADYSIEALANGTLEAARYAVENSMRRKKTAD